MIRVLTALLLAAIASTTHAQTMLVRYDVQTHRAGRLAEPINELTVGQEFDLALYATDLRPDGTYEYAGEERDRVRGVYAAYCDITWDKTKAAVKLATGTSNPRLRFFNAFLFSPDYRAGKQAVEAPDGVARLGGFRGLTFGGDNEPAEVCRVRMTATGMGQVTFAVKLARVLYPMDDTLVYGNLAANPPEQSHVRPSEIILGRCLLNIR